MKIRLPRHQVKILKSFMAKESDREEMMCLGIIDSAIHATDGRRVVRIKLFETNATTESGCFRPFFDGNEIRLYKEKDLEFPNVSSVLPPVDRLVDTGLELDLSRELGKLTMSAIDIFRITGRKISIKYLRDLAGKSPYQVFKKPEDAQSPGGPLYFILTDDMSALSGPVESAIMPMV